MVKNIKISISTKRKTAKAEAGNTDIITDPGTRKRKSTIKRNTGNAVKGKGIGTGTGRGTAKDRDRETGTGKEARGTEGKKRSTKKMRETTCCRPRSRCQRSRTRWQCLRFQGRGGSESGPVRPWATTDVIRQITMDNSGIPFHGSPA